jgi:2-methylcitrate dehydratase PrpD
VSLGYDVMVDLALALGPSHRRYWQATATAGCVGAAATGAYLMGLPASEVDAAAAHAISIAGGSIRALVERSGTRLVHRAHAVETGLLSASAAATGLDGTAAGLEAPDGLFAAMAPLGEPDRLTVARSRPALEETAPRLRATSGFGQSAVEAASQLGPLNPEHVSSVAITVSAAACGAAGVVFPVDDDQAWWSIPYAVARCLIAGDPAPLAEDFRRTPSIDRLLERTALGVGAVGAGASVEVALASGEPIRCDISAPLGHPERPATEADLQVKWEQLVGSEELAALAELRSLLDRPWRETVRIGLGDAIHPTG